MRVEKARRRVNHSAAGACARLEEREIPSLDVSAHVDRVPE